MTVTVYPRLKPPGDGSPGTVTGKRDGPRRANISVLETATAIKCNFLVPGCIPLISRPGELLKGNVPE